MLPPDSILLQSMTNTLTADIEATVAQCRRIFDRGAGMVRITTPTLKDVEHLAQIRKILNEEGYTLPLAADVHFNPAIAEAAARVVEKVRINPGNYLPGKYSGPDTPDPLVKEAEMQRIRERLLPLINICREHKTAIRIGVNHGSLSERIMKWYGDSPEGMAESAMEFIRIFHDEGFEDLVISLKASSVRVMVYANRLLAQRMEEAGYHYPFHLGVTEAGDEEDGRIKSATGIGTLLKEGIGKTIRVSLTEDPEEEIPVARQIVKQSKEILSLEYSVLSTQYSKLPTQYSKLPTQYSKLPTQYSKLQTSLSSPQTKYSKLQTSFLRRASQPIGNIGNARPPVVVSSTEVDPGSLHKNMIPDYIALPASNEILSRDQSRRISLISAIPEKNSLPQTKYSKLQTSHLLNISTPENESIARQYLRETLNTPDNQPVILKLRMQSAHAEEMMIKAAVTAGPFFLDGLADGIWLEEENPDIPQKLVIQTAFGILQATGARITKTEYIACPSCGRTLFDIQKVLKKVKIATADFSGLKIAVMGCIVNGPGEMADADYGYVGAGPGKVTIYKGKTPVKKNVPEEKAVDELIRVIREYSS